MHIGKASLVLLFLLLNIHVWTQEEAKVDASQSASLPEEEARKLEVVFRYYILL